MKISPTLSQTWLRVTGLWSDVSLVVFGEQRTPNNPNPTLIKLGEFAAKDLAHDKAVALGALAEAGAFKYVALRFRCQTFPTNLGRVDCKLIAHLPATPTDFSEVASFSFEKSPTSNAVLKHSEPIQWP